MTETGTINNGELLPVVWDTLTRHNCLLHVQREEDTGFGR